MGLAGADDGLGPDPPDPRQPTQLARVHAPRIEESLQPELGQIGLGGRSAPDTGARLEDEGQGEIGEESEGKDPGR